MKNHPIHDLSEKEADIFHEEDGLVLAEIDQDEDEEFPIFGVALDNGAYTVFYFKDEGGIRVLWVENNEEQTGELTRMMDFITERFEVYDIEFFNVTNEDLLEVLDNPSTKTKGFNDPNYEDRQKVIIAQTTWEPNG